jgi:hypothetical protein
VDRAAELVDTKGKEAFSEFRQRGSEWFSGDTYIFAYAPDGTVVLNPAFPAREGHAYHGEKDKKGKAFHDEIIKTAQTKGSGWVDYWLPKPGQTEPSQKWSYVKAVKAEGVAVVGAGFFPEWRVRKGHKSNVRCDVRFGSKADMAAHSSDVRFTPKSGHRCTRAMSALCHKQTLAGSFDQLIGELLQAEHFDRRESN